MSDFKSGRRDVKFLHCGFCLQFSLGIFYTRRMFPIVCVCVCVAITLCCNPKMLKCFYCSNSVFSKSEDLNCTLCDVVSTILRSP